MRLGPVRRPLLYPVELQALEVDNFCSIGMQALPVNWVKTSGFLDEPPEYGRTCFRPIAAVLSEIPAVDFSKSFALSSIPSGGGEVAPVKKDRQTLAIASFLAFVRGARVAGRNCDHVYCQNDLLWRFMREIVSYRPMRANLPAHGVGGCH